MGIFLDILIGFVIFLCVLRGYKRGFIRTVFGIISFGLAIVLSFMFYVSFAQYFKQTPVGISCHNSIKSSVIQSLTQKRETGEIEKNTSEDMLKALNLPTFLNSSVYQNSMYLVRNSDDSMSGEAFVMDTVGEAAASALVRILTGIILFVGLLILFYILRIILETIFKLPLLKGVNKGAGVAAGLVKGVLVAYFILGIIAFMGNLEGFVWMKAWVNSSIIFQNMYQNNIIFSLFAK